MKWTPEKLEALRRRYPHEHNSTLARELGCSPHALAFRARQLGIATTEACDEARHARMASRATEERAPCERRVIATGTLIRNGNVLTHISHTTRWVDCEKSHLPPEDE